MGASPNGPSSSLVLSVRFASISTRRVTAIGQETIGRRAVDGYHEAGSLGGIDQDA